MPNLSNLAGGKVPDYIEFAWVCAPAAAGQSITANVITTLSCTNIVQNTGNLAGVSIANNQFTIPTGTYYYEAKANVALGHTYGGSTGTIISLYNITDSSYIGRMRISELYSWGFEDEQIFNGQFTIIEPKTLALRAICSYGSVNGYSPSNAFTSLTTTEDQRTTIKLWKLK